MSRETFRRQCVERDGGECLVPWCNNEVTVDPDGPGEVHHVIERELWPNGGYIADNGASLCNDHHRMAEQNEIPPQALWRWADIRYVPYPFNNNGTMDVAETKYGPNIDKWGEELQGPPHWSLREYHKYPSTRHLLPLYWRSYRSTADERADRDDTGLTSVESFLGIPLVVTIKMDGSNAMLVSDADEPVRARNGSHADHESFDHLKQAYWDRNVYERLPSHLQVFGENMYAKHSIHYGCSEGISDSEEAGDSSLSTDCGGCDERNQAPAVADLFLVFGVYDTRYDLWLSWPEVERVADRIGFETVPSAGGHRINEIGQFGGSPQDYYAGQYDQENELIEYLTSRAERVIDNGHEGIVVRSMYPFHYGQFDRKVAKYVRPNHVQTDEHWSHQETVRNVIDDQKT
jgi:hypothetical protein